MDPARRRRLRLVIEFSALFVGVPLTLAFLLPPTAMFTVLGVMTGVGILLLHRTPGFDWAELLRGPVPWPVLLAALALTAAVGVAGTLALFPHMLFFLPKQQPSLWLMILVLYPLLSALPQELLFRPLFFRRYGQLFPSVRIAVWANALLFSVAHLMYADPLVMGITFAGGWLFGWLYAVRGSFGAALLLHAVAGQILFTTGLGILFYSGAVGR
ncbi:CPBP family intramembrane metalloprotease [Rhodobacteraceae bacterium 2CG4]|uniref:CPBP family intramembrane metalloprotease n=2 Tax=Halovulum marinum TaxID=2662447 RepID=A0A6L5YVK8_9RHOB|nr:CPBP family intramembrane metalloprotease [Halovulum marinum]